MAPSPNPDVDLSGADRSKAHASPAPHIAFVRAVMIGREGLHPEVLVDMFRDAGAAQVRSHLATGNVSFVARAEQVVELRFDTVDHPRDLLGRATPLFVRTVAELDDLLAIGAFDAAPSAEVRDRVVTLCRPGAEAALELPVAAQNGDWCAFAAARGAVFSVTRNWPDRQPSAPGGAIERLVGEPVTTRAVGTLERVVARAGDG